MQNTPTTQEKRLTIYVDIDNTICNPDPNWNHELATPIKDHIQKINNLYDAGHNIVYWTARGTLTNKDWREVTEKQFEEWGVKYHDLVLYKPHYDLFIDDKNIEANRFFKEKYYEII